MTVSAPTNRPPVVPGGSFLLQETDPLHVFTPDDFTEEQRMIQTAASEFVEKEIVPRIGALEAQKPGVNPEILRKAAEVGLLSLEIPEEYGGLNMDKACAMIVQECLGRYESFGVTYAAHTGIGMQPIYSFGTEEQKQKYLPPMGEGRLISAYALTEPGSGSDAMGARTRAVLSEDGSHYVVNGSKMWITNAGFCDIFIAFAKVDGEKFTCLIVDRHSPGVTVSEEEKKMGLKGSSTTAVSFDNVKVPVDNVIGQVGKGHQIAFNALNLGRFKLAGAAYGAGVWALNEALTYSTQRTQFGKPISHFGAIQHKLAQIAVRLWILRSMNCRTAGLLDNGLLDVDRKNMKGVLGAIENYAVECSILKVYGTETLDYVVDEAVQVFGGYGFSAEYPAERRYRDSRVNRIFEGTNEINRLIITTRLLKKAQAGELALMDGVQKAMGVARSTEAIEKVTGAVTAEATGDGLLAQETAVTQAARHLALYLAGIAHQTFGDKLQEEQEIISWISDVIIHVYALESGLLRALKKVRTAGEAAATIELDMVRVFTSDTVGTLNSLARQVVGAVCHGQATAKHLGAIRKFTDFAPQDTVQMRRRIAADLLSRGKFAQ